MTDITIARPQVTITHHVNGNTSYKVEAVHWKTEYHRIGWSNDEKTTKKLADGFVKTFEKLAKDIETGDERPYSIMHMFVQNGKFRAVRKLPDTKHAF